MHLAFDSDLKLLQAIIPNPLQYLQISPRADALSAILFLTAVQTDSKIQVGLFNKFLYAGDISSWLCSIERLSIFSFRGA